MKRTRLATGIYKDVSGIAIIVSVHGKPREFRHTPHHESYKDWPLDRLRAERKRILAREILKGDQITRSAHALSADVKRYLATLSGQTKKDTASLLAHWTDALGDQPRHAITSLQLREIAAAWTCAASTYNHRRQALISLYNAFDGKQAPNPARELPKRPEPRHAPKAMRYGVIRAILKAMPECQSRARVKVMAFTGLPGAILSKITPEDWQGTRLRVVPRRKGTGAHGRWLPLDPEAQDALKEFARLQAWGPFSHSSLYAFWIRYAPKGTNPYSLRHSWITELYRRSRGDVIAVKYLAMHSQTHQTERYAAAAIEDRAASLVFPRMFPTTRSRESSKTIQNAPRKPNVPRGRKPRKK